MRLQEFKPGCGAASILNALLAIGETQFQEVVWNVAGGTADGINPASFFNGLHALGFSGKEISTDRRGSAFHTLRDRLSRGIPTILCVDSWDHWVTAIGMIGKRFLIADPADGELVVSLDHGQLHDRWKCTPKRGKKPVTKPFYGISVVKART